MSNAVVASAPGKIILFGEHGVQRGQTSVTTAVDMRTTCRVKVRGDGGYTFQTGTRREEGDRDRLVAFKTRVDALREANDLDAIVELTKDFFVPVRYVLATFVARTLAMREQVPGLDVEWQSELPICSGLGSGAAASTSMIVAAAHAVAIDLSPEEVISLAWQGDVIAHGGRGSSLDSSTCTYGGLIAYSLAEKATRLPYNVSLPLVVGDTLVQHNTSSVDSHVRGWIQEAPEERMRVFEVLGYLVEQFVPALERGDFRTLGHLMNVHQLLQENMGTSCPESDRLIGAALDGGALGAKISGSGGGGVIIALSNPGAQQQVAAAIDAAGGRSYVVGTGAAGARVEEGGI